MRSPRVIQVGPKSNGKCPPVRRGPREKGRAPGEDRGRRCRGPVAGGETRTVSQPLGGPGPLDTLSLGFWLLEPPSFVVIC